MKKETAKKWICLIIVVLLIACIGQSIVLTDGGNIRVENVKWATDDGAFLNSTLYIPKGVSAENPAPAVVTCHGYNNTAGDMENNSIELARRGYVVIAVDMYGHGSSTYPVGLTTNDDYADGAADGTVALDYEGDAMIIDGGVYSALQYLGALPYVDSENIGIIGHSAGGFAIQLGAWRALARHEADPTVTAPKSILVSCEGADADFNEFEVNIGTITPEFDEFGAGHWNVTTAREATSSPKMKQFFGFTEQSPDLAFNSYYIKGQEAPVSRENAVAAAAEGDLRIPYLIDGVNHPDVNYSNQAISDVADFFNITLQGGQESPIASGNQVWLVKNIFGLVCILCFFLLMIPVASLLLKTKFFATLVRKPYEGIVTAGKQARYWGMFLVGIAVTALLFYPLMGNPIVDKFQGYISDILWPVSRAFPMPIVNSLSLFMLCIAAVTLVIFCVYAASARKKDGLSADAFGWKMPFRDILKALLLGAIVLFVSYMALAVAQYFFHVDFRFLILNIMPVSAVRWGMFLTYAIFFIVYFVINSLVLNVTIPQKGRKEWVNYLLCVIFNVGGLLMIRVIDQAVFAATGIRPLFGYSTLGGNSSMAYILSLSIMFILAINAVISRALYKKSGNIWVSGFVCALAAAFFTISNTVISSGIF